MVVSLNSDNYAVLFQNTNYAKSSSSSNVTSASASSSVFGTDSLQVSQDAINALLKTQEESANSENSETSSDFLTMLQEKLDELVSAGTLSQEQADAVQAALKPPANEAPPDKPGDILGEKLDGLVSSGTLTQEQADAVEEALSSIQRPSGPPPGGPPPGGPPPAEAEEDEFQDLLQSLVDDGTITDEQLEAIQNSLTQTT